MSDSPTIPEGDLSFDVISYAREIVSTPSHHDADEFSACARETLAAMLAAWDRLRERHDTLFRNHAFLMATKIPPTVISVPARETEDGAVRGDVQRALIKLEEAARWHQATVDRRGTNNASEEDLLLAAHLMVEALSYPPRPETKDDAATEAVREAYRGLMLFPYGSPLHRKGMQRLCAALDAALSTPAPAPSAKETRT